VAHTLLAAVIFAYAIAWIQYGIHQGMIDARSGDTLSVFMLATSFGYYFFLRSGLNLRFREPALTVPQILTALTWVCGAYAISNAAHGGLLILYALVMTFGIFDMSKRSAYACSAYALVAMGATMYYKVHSDPEHYPANVEMLYYSFVLIIMPTIGQLSAQITAMRARVRTQKAELELQKAELEQAMTRIRELATRDELTGLINRREMATIAQKHAQLQKRKAVGFSVAMIDLDHFKHINDTWGHAVGDEVLRAFAQQARNVLRETDTISRWGGEEFLVLLPETSGVSPIAALTRLRENLKTYCVRQDIPDLRVTFSAGMTTYRGDESIDDAIARADKALYEAKATGRNKTVQV
jgi:diguanylate cyclase (GGDEF)-like protein